MPDLNEPIPGASATPTVGLPKIAPENETVITPTIDASYPTVQQGTERTMTQPDEETKPYTIPGVPDALSQQVSVTPTPAAQPEVVPTVPANANPVRSDIEGFQVPAGVDPASGPLGQGELTQTIPKPPRWQFWKR